MLHLLQPNIPNRNRFLLQLIIVSALFHVGIGILLLYVQTNQQLYQIIFNNNPIDLVDMIVSPCASAAVQASAPFVAPCPVAKPVTQIAPVLQAPKKEEAAPLPKKTKAKIPPIEKKIEKKVAPTTPKKIATKKNIVEQKKPVQPIQPIKKVVTQKEYDALALQELVQEELQQYWQPPSGLSNNLLCEMAIELDIHGAIKQLECVRSSGVLMYDIHAQSVLLQVRYPKETWGKQLTIMFKQV